MSKKSEIVMSCGHVRNFEFKGVRVLSYKVTTFVVGMRSCAVNQSSVSNEV